MRLEHISHVELAHYKYSILLLFRCISCSSLPFFSFTFFILILSLFYFSVLFILYCFIHFYLSFLASLTSSHSPMGTLPAFQKMLHTLSMYAIILFRIAMDSSFTDILPFVHVDENDSIFSVGLHDDDDDNDLSLDSNIFHFNEVNDIAFQSLNCAI